MNRINSIADLKAERTRLKQKQYELENAIKNDFESIKESFSPAKLVTEGAAKMLVNKNHGLVNQITNVLVDIVLKKVFLRKSGLITRLILPFIAKNTAGNYISDHKTKILGWVGDLILKIGNRKNRAAVTDRTTADINV